MTTRMTMTSKSKSETFIWHIRNFILASLKLWTSHCRKEKTSSSVNSVLLPKKNLRENWLNFTRLWTSPILTGKICFSPPVCNKLRIQVRIRAIRIRATWIRASQIRITRQNPRRRPVPHPPAKNKSTSTKSPRMLKLRRRQKREWCWWRENDPKLTSRKRRRKKQRWKNSKCSKWPNVT